MIEAIQILWTHYTRLVRTIWSDYRNYDGGK